MATDALAERLSVHVTASPGPIALAALSALAYADVFDYPLTASEVQRYLIGVPAGLDLVRLSLELELLPAGWAEAHGAYYTLAGRGELARVRERRQRQARYLWPRARRYAGWLRALPYVRMVALTGALAMDNEPGRDLDFLVVTEPGRLWLCRGLAMLLVRLARRFGDELCPNYFISTQALKFPVEDLYTAHELAQMIPLHGMEVYRTIRRLNAWTDDFLPNAGEAPTAEGGAAAGMGIKRLQRLAETALWTAPGERLERWEMQRKVRKLSAQLGPQAEIDYVSEASYASEGSFAPEASFGRDWCKGHFGGYGRSTLAAYQRRVEGLTGLAIESTL